MFGQTFVPGGCDIESGVYTPTCTPIANITAVNGQPSTWIKIGRIVIVSGQFQINAAAIGIPNTLFSFSLPVVGGNFTTSTQGSGNGTFQNQNSGNLATRAWTVEAGFYMLPEIAGVSVNSRFVFMYQIQ